MLRTGRRLAGVSAFAAAELALAAGCAPPPHPYSLDPAHRGAATVGTVAQLPMNLVVGLQDGLSEPSERVAGAIAEYLRACGKRVVAPGFLSSRELWIEATREAEASGATGGEDPFDEAVRRFATHLREEVAFDAVLMPSLVYRKARILPVTHEVIWDGVKRELEVRGMPRLKGSMHLEGDFAGEMPGVSLHLLVFDAGGRRVFESYGGLDLVHLADVTDSAETFRWELVMKRHPLEDEVVLREGLRVAFEPYLLPPPSDVAEGP